MHRTIGYLSKRFAHIRPGEERKVMLTFLYFFLVITAYYIIKPVSRSLVLGELGSRMVPYIDLICALLMGPIVTVFARLVDRMAKPRLVSLSFVVVTAVMIGFWQLLAWPHSWVAGAFYVWVAIFSVLAVTLFWLVANDLYRPREAKRLFGFIGSGGILGGIAGSSIAAVGAQVVGSQHLLLCSAGLLVGCWLVVQQLWRLAPEPIRDEQPAAHPSGHRETFLSHPKAFLKTLLQSRYLLLLVALVGINKVVAALIYYQFNPFIEQTFTDVNARTTFTSLFFGSINVLAFIIQFFFTSWILRRWGLGMALLALPVGVLAGTTGMLLLPVFWLAATTELYDASMNYSLQQTSKEVLYLPIDRSIRYKVKPFIDMVVFRFGKGIAAVIGIVLLDVLGVPGRFLVYVTVPCVVLWVVVAAKLRHEYTTTLRTTLQARAVSRRTASAAAGHPAAASHDADAPHSLGTLTTARSSHQKLSLAEKLVSGKAESPHIRELLQGLMRYEQPPAASSSDKRFEVLRLKATIQHRAATMGERRYAVRLLARQADQDVLDYLCGMLLVEEEAALRNEVVRELVKIRLARRRLQLPIALIRRQIVREVKNYERIVQVASVYRQHQRGVHPADDPIVALLRVLMEESLEQAFRLLMLLYRPEDIHLVYEQMQVADAYVRADAIELLDNLVDPAMRAMIAPLFDEDRFLSIIDEAPRVAHDPTTAYRIFQEAIWDHNCWLSVTTLCAVGQLRLTTMRQELEKASRHAESLISTAAKVALHLSHTS
ncbi:MAG: Npt1/Npt2 family nucleotide transporter [Candidatus Omnitrophota bacterium]|nr:Npt1/Npt2 family nucleotide transporter [Candidatus Omnitrophota bacterium]